MRVSCTALESFRLWSNPDNEWMDEKDLLATIRGDFVPTHNVELGSAFGKVLEDPDRYLVPGGFSCGTFQFGRDVVEPCLAVIDRRGVFEAKAVKSYGGCDVVAKADHLFGSRLSEFKTTLNSFDIHKYFESCQWRFMADIFEPRSITYHVFCLSEAVNGVISLRAIESFNLYPYPALHEDCCELVARFEQYADVRGLRPFLEQRQKDAA